MWPVGLYKIISFAFKYANPHSAIHSLKCCTIDKTIAERIEVNKIYAVNKNK